MLNLCVFNIAIYNCIKFRTISLIYSRFCDNVHLQKSTSLYAIGVCQGRGSFLSNLSNIVPFFNRIPVYPSLGAFVVQKPIKLLIFIFISGTSFSKKVLTVNKIIKKVIIFFNINFICSSKSKLLTWITIYLILKFF